MISLSDTQERRLREAIVHPPSVAERTVVLHDERVEVSGTRDNPRFALDHLRLLAERHPTDDEALRTAVDTYLFRLLLLSGSPDPVVRRHGLDTLSDTTHPPEPDITAS